MNVSVVSCDVVVVVVVCGFEMCPNHAIELRLADSNSAQLLILHGLATRRKAQATTTRTTTTVVVGSPTTKYQQVLGGQSVCAFCIGGWYFYCIFFLFYLLCLLFFAMAMATTASVVIANILVATPAPVRSVPSPVSRQGLCDSWLEVMTKSVGNGADTETTSTTCVRASVCMT